MRHSAQKQLVCGIWANPEHQRFEMEGGKESSEGPNSIKDLISSTLYFLKSQINAAYFYRSTAPTTFVNLI